MNLFPKKSLEYAVISRLQKNSWITVDLIEDLKKTRPKLTKQAVYQAIRKLRKSEIVVASSKKVSLSALWVNRMYAFFAAAKKAYSGAAQETGERREDFLSLEDGDQITYLFKDPKTTDIFWGHASNALRGVMPDGEPMYIYTPHEWSMLAREQTEKSLMKMSEEDGHPWYVYIPHKDPLDDLTKMMFTRPSLAHTQAKHYFRENFYVNTHGDYIIEVLLDPKTQASIDEFYKTYDKWDDEAKARLGFIVSHMKGRNRLTISKNAKKSAKYKQLFRKYFPTGPREPGIA